MATPYEKEVIDILIRTKGQAVAFLVVEGTKGTSFEVRATHEKYLRQLPAALIEIASRIEGDLAKQDLERKKQEMEKNKNA